MMTVIILSYRDKVTFYAHLFVILHGHKTANFNVVGRSHYFAKVPIKSRSNARTTLMFSSNPCISVSCAEKIMAICRELLYYVLNLFVKCCFACLLSQSNYITVILKTCKHFWGYGTSVPQRLQPLLLTKGCNYSAILLHSSIHIRTYYCKNFFGVVIFDNWIHQAVGILLFQLEDRSIESACLLINLPT